MQSKEELSATELRAQLDAARRRLDELTEEVARNDDKMLRTQQRELQLLQAEDLDSLLSVLVDGLRVSYGLEYVSVVLCDPDHDIRHLLLANGTPAESYPNLVIIESLAGLAPQYIALHQPWLGSFAACDHQMICPNATGMKSIAMIPLKHRGKLLGSINLCCSDGLRFTRDHASDFLAHLGTIASYCVENTINRARLLRSGFTDVLTGWNNRRYLSVRLLEELARARRDKSGIVCLMLDVDHFKHVNDTCGHPAGDRLIRKVADQLKRSVNDLGIVARFGGDEFAVLVPDVNRQKVKSLAQKILEDMRRLAHIEDNNVFHVQCSMGIVMIVDDQFDHDEIIAQSDIACREAKAGGRNRCRADSKPERPTRKPVNEEGVFRS